MMNNVVRLLSFVILFSAFFSCRSTKNVSFSDLKYPKREFRGAWLSTAWQSRYKNMNSEEMKEYFTSSLDKLQKMGINAVVFQVRPQADAFYRSKYEPWSAHLTGKQGLAPSNGFDPLSFLVEECHKRGIELHAWLNPYRVTTSNNDQLINNHVYYIKPDLFVKYGDKIYFDPGMEGSREHICKVVRDIVMNYDVDAIHMDDYFYPYPIKGVDFPDDGSFRKYNRGFESKEDWRRDNVNLLIKEIKATLLKTKPWVRFGISPFGIYRNKKSTPDGSGSDTNGLQNYDDLYADVKLWVKEGWIDYNMPQLYWEIGHKSADYTTLLDWWSKNNYGKPLYIGQDVTRTMDAEMAPGQSQLTPKILQERGYKDIGGMCFWPAYSLLDNYKGIGTELESEFFSYPALIPAYTEMYKKIPKTIKLLKEHNSMSDRYLTWRSDSTPNDPQTAFFYVIYRFKKGEKVDINKAQNIVAITSDTIYKIPLDNESASFKYVVTAVDRFNNESKPRFITIKPFRKSDKK